LWHNGAIATLNPGGNPYGLIERGAVAANNGAIVWVGPAAELDGEPRGLARRVIDLENRLMTPGLVDCHSHLVYGGNRAREFEMRLDGATYEEIARAGGGIVSTVAATREASEHELFATAERRLLTLMAEGVTTIEIKSGYGLETETELKMLKVARRLGETHDIRVKTSFLGAHALPPEFAEDRQAYIDLVANEMLPKAHDQNLADAVDGFCENIAFSAAEMETVFKAAQKLGLPVKLHAEQLSDQKGTIMAAGYGALSADHLEYLGADGVEAMARAGMVAVLLPGAFYCIKETQTPPVDLLRQHDVPIAIATDANPGSSPVLSL
jgi:imidazolonepropionase